jgi:hydrogenase nickel incorporation protein HypA/HybF
MHELSVAEALIDQVTAELDRTGQRGPVTRVDIAIGWLSGVHCEALRFAFELLAPGTVVEAARLSIRQPPAVSYCRSCGAEEEIDGMVADCPRCHSPEIAIDQGRELLLESIELED